MMNRHGVARSTAEMYDPASPAVALEPYQCWTKLQDSRTGRIVTVASDRIEIRPVNFVADGHSIVFDTSSEVVRSAAAEHRPVVFEVDEHDGWSVWSVIVRGTVAETDDLDLPEGTELRSMLPTVKRTRLRLTPDEITGRLFDQAP
ncbi:pyridoxamine 5'-phosphate oxidase family protein [Curtobacterium sp. VKM Ac-1393]|uniref:pyridoxamine 5'-phosphate oxidase family protein n=1 Tax=Curtobacterium sp. VKM Ac-1393 TaxID=2783814 RepID=UPI001889EAA6|nr:pyridoxamine 5'-phosphate oxidase family protein [Curtobacterium sp. VKM Ac-1393]MBF4606905.1 pyridoxamine 5'-phosphate oxidase family protein [Curtobacterium sp. VKM Ac-1393]